MALEISFGNEHKSLCSRVVSSPAGSPRPGAPGVSGRWLGQKADDDDDQPRHDENENTPEQPAAYASKRLALGPRRLLQHFFDAQRRDGLVRRQQLHRDEA